LIPRRTAFLRPDLEPNESVVWEGPPQTSTLIRPHERPQYLNGSVLVVFGCAMLAMRIPTFFACWALYLGFYCITGWRFWDAFVRSRTWYTLTNKLACIGKDFGLFIPVRSYVPINWLPLEVLPENLGSTVVFTRSQRSWLNRLPMHYLRGPMDSKAGFEMIAEGENIFEKMQAMLREDTP